MKAAHSKGIALVGAGNVAWHLAQAFTAAGHSVKVVYSRTASSREELAALLPAAQPISSLNLQETATEVVLISVPDAALAMVADNLKVSEGTIVAHTSGSQSLAVLDQVKGARTGVFYPLQTFSKTKPVDLSQAPILIEAIQENTQLELEELALSISNQVQKVSSNARRQLHLAAVFACNFTNHLLGISQQLLKEANLPKELLHPLVQETVAKAMLQNLYEVQTGPAIRHDSNVIKSHLEMLENHPSFQLLYQALTDSIQRKKEKSDS